MNYTKRLSKQIVKRVLAVRSRRTPRTGRNCGDHGLSRKTQMIANGQKTSGLNTKDDSSQLHSLCQIPKTLINAYPGPYYTPKSRYYSPMLSSIPAFTACVTHPTCCSCYHQLHLGKGYLRCSKPIQHQHDQQMQSNAIPKERIP